MNTAHAFGFIMVSLSLFGCVASQAWVAASNKDGGVIGYKMGDGGNAGEDLKRMIQSRAEKICGTRTWRTVGDELKSRSSTVSGIMPQISTTESNYNYTSKSSSSGNIYGSDGYNARFNTRGETTGEIAGTQTTTTYVPYTYNSTEYWREAQIVCDSESPNEVAARLGRRSDVPLTIGVTYAREHPQYDGVEILKLDPNGSAAGIGLKEGDIILQLGHTVVKTPDELYEIVNKLLPDSTTEIVVCVKGECFAQDIKVRALSH